MATYQFPGPQEKNIMQDIIKQKAKGRITHNHMVTSLYDIMDYYGISEVVLGNHCRLRKMKDEDGGLVFKQVFISGIGEKNKACPACGETNYSFIRGEHTRVIALCSACACVYLREVIVDEKVSESR